MPGHRPSHPVRPGRHGPPVAELPERVRRRWLHRAEVAPGLQGLRSLAALRPPAGILERVTHASARHGCSPQGEDRSVRPERRLRPRLRRAGGWGLPSALVRRADLRRRGRLRRPDLPAPSVSGQGSQSRLRSADDLATHNRVEPRGAGVHRDEHGRDPPGARCQMGRMDRSLL